MSSIRERFNDLIHAPVAGYDLIGDIHGCALTLGRLLERLGYRKRQGVYHHPERRVIFLGDIIDRGPRIREALSLVHSMVEAGHALMVLGNHEFNALTWTSTDSEGNFLRPHTERNARQINETLEQFANFGDEWRDYLSFFAELPLFLEVPAQAHFSAFRVVHACWDQRLIELHRHRYGEGYFDEQFIQASVIPTSVEYATRQHLTSGIDLPLPQGMKMLSTEGYLRTTFRTKFWAQAPKTYGDLAFQPDPLPDEVANTVIDAAHQAQIVHYDRSEPPLFVGHYWLNGQPAPLAPNLACLDYSAVKYGRLVGYRMDGESTLSVNKFVWEYVLP